MASPIRPIASPRLFERIAGEIARLIDDGTWAPGTRLPPERELAQRFAVSRSSLREALAMLELRGRIEIRVGSGAYVKAPRARKAAPVRGTAEISPFDVLRTRRLVEGEAAALAACNATLAQLRALDKAFALLAQDMRAGRMQSPADRRFHLGIAAASGNAALALVIERLWEEGARPLGVRIEKLFVTRGRKRDNIGEHRAILEAIRKRDPDAARRAMRTHLRNAERQRMAMRKGP